MAYNRVELDDGTILIDISSDTTFELNVDEDIIFHKADGTQSTGLSTYKKMYKNNKWYLPILVNGNLLFANEKPLFKDFKLKEQ